MKAHFVHTLSKRLRKNSDLPCAPCPAYPALRIEMAFRCSVVGGASRVARSEGLHSENTGPSILCVRRFPRPIQCETGSEFFENFGPPVR